MPLDLQILWTSFRAQADTHFEQKQTKETKCYLRTSSLPSLPSAKFFRVDQRRTPIAPLPPCSLRFLEKCFCLLCVIACLFSGTALAQTAEKPKHNLLFIGQAKGYQHEAISTAMATFYNLGRNSGLWNTMLRTDCTAITKKPLKWEAKNLNAFDVIVFFTDGELDMDESQKADLLSFVRDDGKGFIGIHSAAITFTGWPEYGHLLGGYFDGHPWGEFNAPLIVEDSKFPGMKDFPATF